MNRRDFLVLAAGVLSASPACAQAQSVPIIGFLNTGRAGPAKPLLDAFNGALNSAGYEKGSNVLIEYRWAEGRYDRLETLATDLVRRNVDVIAATGGTVAAKAAKAVTSTIPVLFIAGFDPVKEGLVASINRPGGNATGVAVYTAELGKKRLEILHRLVKRARLAMLVNPGAVSTAVEVADAKQFAVGSGLTLMTFEARTFQEIEAAFGEAVDRGAAGLLISADSFFTSQRSEIVALAARHKLPVCYPWPQYPEAGGLISYGPNLAWAYQQIGIYVARILKGDKASELPVVFPTKFDTTINLRTAKQLGDKIQTDALLVADQFIE